MDGILLVNKPAGMTSFDVIRKCKHIFHEKKIGHTGTLDPNAEGLMIVLLGKYTKLVPYCIKDHKQYYAEFIFGTNYDTGDIWGNAIDEKSPNEHTESELQNLSTKLVGDINQLPPMYSALKKDGKKYYEYARAGIEIEREIRRVHVDYIEVRKKDENLFSMSTSVSSGTYVRTLITDLGDLAGEFAAMSYLRRNAIEMLTADEANTLDGLETDPVWIKPEQVIDPEYQQLEMNDISRILNGMTVKLPTEHDKVIITHNGELIAAYQKLPNGYHHCIRGLR